MQREKNVLCTNISCLFKTAQLEIGRKDAEIEQLRTSRMQPSSRHRLAQVPPAQPTLARQDGGVQELWALSAARQGIDGGSACIAPTHAHLVDIRTQLGAIPPG